MKSLSIILLLVCLLGCKSNKTSTSNNPDAMEKSYLEVAKEELGEGATCEESKDKAYVLCRYIDKKNQTVKSPNTSKSSPTGGFRVKYFVWDTSKGVVVNQAVLASGEVSWYNNTELKIVEEKGMDAPASVYLYNVVTKKRRDLNSEKP